MKKPQEETRVEVFFDYNKCSKYIDYKHDCDIRDFGRKPPGELRPDGPYRDFWHYIGYMCEPGRDDFFYMEESWLRSEYRPPEDWQKEILLWFLDEYVGIGDTQDRTIRFWAEW